jgi:hypothetical protein
MLVNQSKSVDLNRAQDVSSKLMRQFIHALDGIRLTVLGTTTLPDRDPWINYKFLPGP